MLGISITESINIDDRLLFYIFVPICDWIAISAVYYGARWSTKYNSLRLKYPIDTRFKIKQFAVVFAVCAVITYLIVNYYHKHNYGLLAHYFKVAGMIIIPAMFGVYRGFEKFALLSDEEKKTLVKQLEINS